MKILFLNHGCEIGGAERVLLTLLDGIDKSTFDCWLVCPEKGELIEQANRIPSINTKIIYISPNILQLRRKGLSFRSLLGSAPELLRSILRLKKFIENKRFDLIYTNSTKAHIYGSLVSMLTRVPIVWRLHDILSQEFFDIKVIRIISMIANIVPKKILCVSNSVLKVLEAVGVPERKLLTIYNGVDAAFGHDESYSLRSEFNILQSSVLVGWFGRLTPWKGPDIFLKAAKGVLQVCDNICFVIVGDTLYEADEYYGELTNLSRELAISDRIIFTGYRENSLRLMASVDILAHTSVLPDPLPTVVLEGARLGKAIVAANAGGVPEIIQNGKQGLMVPPNDVRALSQAIIELLKNPDRRERLGKAAKEKVLRKFSKEAYVDAMEHILKTIR